jgi:hypothetical protein
MARQLLKQFGVLYLNRRNALLEDALIAQGSPPRKARSTRSHVPVSTLVEAYDRPLPADRPAVISYFRQGRLDKFFHPHNGNTLAEELDFFTTAEILETTAKEARGDIQAELFYPLLDKNKSGFHAATSPSVETLLPSTAAGGGNEAILLKRLRVTSFHNYDAFKTEDRKYVTAVHQIIADGRVGEATLRKVKEAFDKTADPLEMLAILRKEIAGQYLLGGSQRSEQIIAEFPREVILASFLT